MTEEFQAFTTIPNWMMRDQTISGHAKLVYLSLNSRTARHAVSWPSHALIARECGISVTTVKTALNELKALGVVRWEKQIRDDGGASSNRYYLRSSLEPAHPPTP